MKWHYSLRWKLPSPCPGPHELASEVVEAGQPAPESILTKAGSTDTAGISISSKSAV